LQGPEFEIKKSAVLAKKTIMRTNEESLPPSLSSSSRSNSEVKEKSPKPKRPFNRGSRPFLNLFSTTPKIALSYSSVKRPFLAQKNASADNFKQDSVSVQHTLRHLEFKLTTFCFACFSQTEQDQPLDRLLDAAPFYEEFKDSPPVFRKRISPKNVQLSESSSSTS
jgi:hypothetical protein